MGDTAIGTGEPYPGLLGDNAGHNRQCFRQRLQLGFQSIKNVIIYQITLYYLINIGGLQASGWITAFQPRLAAE